MDSFAEPRRTSAPVSLAAVRDQVRKLEADHRAAGIPLSGRIIHVCHYLPVVSSLNAPRAAGIPSPPQTPPAKAADIPDSPLDAPSASPFSATDSPATDTQGERWTLGVRYGHSAMVSGIASLAATHEQLVIGWTGDITTAPTSESAAKVLSKDISAEDRTQLEGLLAKYRSRDEVAIEDGKRTTYIPVWLDDRDAHGHYEGYCKQSMSLSFSLPLRLPVYLLYPTILLTFAALEPHFFPPRSFHLSLIPSLGCAPTFSLRFPFLSLVLRDLPVVPTSLPQCLCCTYSQSLDFRVSALPAAKNIEKHAPRSPSRRESGSRPTEPICLFRYDRLVITRADHIVWGGPGYANAPLIPRVEPCILTIHSFIRAYINHFQYPHLRRLHGPHADRSSH